MRFSFYEGFTAVLAGAAGSRWQPSWVFESF
ncbi:hypothetical protein N234_10345 [Ralstonia pickettii DTP0602]|nr:hypothetical protein N234_10345 [Ralstonia pickettii DTP0602]